MKGAKNNSAKTRQFQAKLEKAFPSPVLAGRHAHCMGHSSTSMHFYKFVQAMVEMLMKPDIHTLEKLQIGHAHFIAQGGDEGQLNYSLLTSLLYSENNEHQYSFGRTPLSLEPHEFLLEKIDLHSPLPPDLLCMTTRNSRRQGGHCSMNARAMKQPNFIMFLLHDDTFRQMGGMGHPVWEKLLKRVDLNAMGADGKNLAANLLSMGSLTLARKAIEHGGNPYLSKAFSFMPAHPNHYTAADRMELERLLPLLHNLAEQKKLTDNISHAKISGTAPAGRPRKI